MTQPTSPGEFVRAWEAGAFDHRVELVDGQIWPVVIGPWQGDTVALLLALLPRSEVRLTTATLPTGESLPDPACWVVTQEAIHVHSGPISTGYRTRVQHLHGERIPVPYAATDLAVDDLIGPLPA